jgi:hypothetical protein
MDSHPTDTASQEANREQVKLRNRLVAMSEVDDIKWLMGSKRGRRIVHRLLESAGVFRISFHTNALQMAFNEGNRNQGNALLALVTEHCPDRYAELLNEAKEK